MIYKENTDNVLICISLIIVAFKYTNHKKRKNIKKNSIKYYRNKKGKKQETKMCLIGGTRTLTKSEGNIGVFQAASLSIELYMLIPSNALPT